MTRRDLEKYYLTRVKKHIAKTWAFVIYCFSVTSCYRASLLITLHFLLLSTFVTPFSTLFSVCITPLNTHLLRSCIITAQFLVCLESSKCSISVSCVGVTLVCCVHIQTHTNTQTYAQMYIKYVHHKTE